MVYGDKENVGCDLRESIWRNAQDLGVAFRELLTGHLSNPTRYGNRGIPFNRLKRFIVVRSDLSKLFYFLLLY